MTELERLEAELNKRQITKAKSEATMEQIEAVWQKDYETTDPGEISKIAKNLEVRLKKAKEELETCVDEASKLLGLA